MQIKCKRIKCCGSNLDPEERESDPFEEPDLEVTCGTLPLRYQLTRNDSSKLICQDRASMISFSMISWFYLDRFENLTGSCLACMCEQNWLLARTCGHVTALLPPSRTPPPSPSLHKSELLHRDEVCSICLKHLETLWQQSTACGIDLTLNISNLLCPGTLAFALALNRVSAPACQDETRKNVSNKSRLNISRAPLSWLAVRLLLLLPYTSVGCLDSNTYII